MAGTPTSEILATIERVRQLGAASKILAEAVKKLRTKVEEIENRLNDLEAAAEDTK